MTQSILNNSLVPCVTHLCVLNIDNVSRTMSFYVSSFKKDLKKETKIVDTVSGFMVWLPNQFLPY